MGTPGALRASGTSARWPSPSAWSPRREILEIKVNVLPGPDPLPARAAEEAARERRDREEDRDDREQTDRELAVLERAAGIAVHVGQQRHADEDEAGNQHAGDGGREVVQDLLQAEEVPRRLGRVG